jgi:ferredoxin-NADP reductase
VSGTQVAAVTAFLPRAQRAALIENATLVHREAITTDIHVLHVRPDIPIPFVPGQYVSIGLRAHGTWIHRPYSPAGSSTDAVLQLLVRRVVGGALTPQLWERPPGARLHVGPAKGLFRLAAGDQRLHLMLATGTGIAPLVSMTEALMAVVDPPQVVLIHGVRHPEELAFRERLAALAKSSPSLKYTAVASRLRADTDPIRAGRALDLLPQEWAALEPDPDAVVAYLCGNPDVVEAASSWLVGEAGLPAAAVRTEEYWPMGTVSHVRATGS